MRRCCLSSDSGQNEIRILITEQLLLALIQRNLSCPELLLQCIEFSLSRFGSHGRVSERFVVFDHAISIAHIGAKRKWSCATLLAGTSVCYIAHASA